MRLLKDLAVMGLQKELSNYFGLVCISHPSISAKALGRVRRSVRSSGGRYQIAAKRLLARAVCGSSCSDTKGGDAVAAVFVDENFVSIIKALEAEFKSVFGKKFDVEYQFGILDGVLMNKDRASQISSFRTKEEMLAELIGILSAPAMKFTAWATRPMMDLTSILEQLADKQK